jgi:Uncharacterized conserved protein
MKKFYVAAFMPAEEGGFDIVIPDVPNAFTCAETIEEGFVMAEEVLTMMLRDLAADKKDIPEPSSLAVVKAKTAEHLRGIDHVPAGEILYQLIPAPTLDMTPVKVTISLPKAVLEEIDRMAKSEGFTRSGFITHAAQLYASIRE